MSDQGDLVIRAIKTQQGDEVDVYAFFLFGSDLTRVADISRIHRDEENLKGFQRQEIREHVRSIVEFLDSGPILFPNAITLALAPEVSFEASRGPRPEGLIEVGASGTLTIPLRDEGERAAWIVDGQQRALALARAKNSRIPVPVIGFVSSNLQTHREQFILVNKVKPLDARLIDELLPEVTTLLPKDLATRKLPSELCNLLNRETASPFYRLIKRTSSKGAGAETAVVIDTAMIEAIKRNLKSPMSALSQYRQGDETCDADGMYGALVAFWSAVRGAFPDAWGKPPGESRLMHSTGIRAMAAVMDPIMLRADSAVDPATEIRESLERLAPHCRWTEGTWKDLNWKWSDVQQTAQHITKLSEHLIRLDRELSRRPR
jgi:DGQHR domain-containing protein